MVVERDVMWKVRKRKNIDAVEEKGRKREAAVERL